MSLYNMLFGQNIMSDFILATIGLTQQDVGRFRDCFIEKAGNGDFVIAVYTRNGGGNREHWNNSYKEYVEGENCPCPGCIIEYKLPKHPLYIKDRDDDFDHTYATIYFKLPKEYEKELIQWVIADKKTASNKFLNLIESLEKGEQTPQTKKALEVGRIVFDKIKQVQEG